MATLAQANTYNANRGNTEWANLVGQSTARATALLEDAEQYIRSRFTMRTDLTEYEQSMFDNLVCRLANTFVTSPPQDAAAATVKKQVSDLKGLKKETEFNEVGSDPYPFVTILVGPLTVRTSGYSLGRLRRL